MSLSDTDHLEVHSLCDALVDGVITDKQHARLEQILATSEDARRIYVRAMALSSSLMEYAGELQSEASETPVTSGRVHRPATWIWGIGSLAAAAALVLAFWMGWRQERPDTGAVASNATQAEDDDSIARLSGSKDSRWAGAAIPTGSELQRGQRIELTSGFAEITFDSGAQITLEGPASLDLQSAWDATLHRGTLKASVPPEAVGFRVSNASVDVIDLGTEFSMVADGSGATEVFVLRGAVEAAARDGAGNEGPPVVLREKQSRRFARLGGSEVRDHDAKFARLNRKIAFDRITSPAKYVHWSFDDAGRSFTAPDNAQFAAPFLPTETDGGDLLRARVEGYRGSGVNFDGRLSVKSAIPGLHQRSARTVAFWVKVPADAPLTDAGAMASWPMGPTGRVMSAGWNRNPAQGPLGSIRTEFGRGYMTGSTSLRDGRWHHLAVVFSPRVRPAKGDKIEPGIQLRHYVDGRLEIAPGKHAGRRPKGTDASTESTAEDALWLGRAMNRPEGDAFVGTIDELFVADAALTPQEILHLLRENKPASPEMLAAQ